MSKVPLASAVDVHVIRQPSSFGIGHYVVMTFDPVHRRQPTNPSLITSDQPPEGSAVWGITPQDAFNLMRLLHDALMLIPPPDAN